MIRRIEAMMNDPGELVMVMDGVGDAIAVVVVFRLSRADDSPVALTMCRCDVGYRPVVSRVHQMRIEAIQTSEC